MVDKTTPSHEGAGYCLLQAYAQVLQMLRSSLTVRQALFEERFVADGFNLLAPFAEEGGIAPFKGTGWR